MKFALIMTLVLSISAFGGQLLTQKDIDIESILLAKQLQNRDNPVLSTTDFVNVWYGNLDSSNIVANIDDDVVVDVYIQTSTDAYVANK